jgi:hypothetical protein
MLLRNIGCRLAPWVAFTVEAIWGSILHVARQQTGPGLRHQIQKRSEAGQELEQRTPPVSKESPSLLSPCYLLLEKSSKSIISHDKFPFLRNSSLFFWKISLFPGKNSEKSMAGHDANLRARRPSASEGRRPQIRQGYLATDLT